MDRAGVEALMSRAVAMVIKYNAAKEACQSLSDTVGMLEEKKASLIHSRKVLESSKPYIDALIEQFSVTALKRLEDLLTLGLSRIFHDRDYRAEIRVSEKRSAKCAEIYLIDSGHPFPMRDSAVAGGILVVAGFLIQAFYVANLQVSKVIFLDEALSNISTLYLDNFFSFVKELSRQIGLTVILITHDTRFLGYADRMYKVENGVYTLAEGGELDV